jgi:hypothetical protein
MVMLWRHFRQGADYPTEDSIPFDLNKQPCSFFRGRDDILRILSAYFGEDAEQLQRRRTFAICGLGQVLHPEELGHH